MQKKIIISAMVILVIVMGIYILRNFPGEKKSSQPETQEIYQALVIVRDQKNSNQAEDARSSLKAGDVLLVKKGDSNPWSDTEKISNLILKMEMTETQARNIIASVAEKLSEEDKKNKIAGRGDALSSDELKKYAEELDKQENIILLRKYRINLEKIGFKLEDLSQGQPFENDIFNWDIVQEKQGQRNDT